VGIDPHFESGALLARSFRFLQHTVACHARREMPIGSSTGDPTEAHPHFALARRLWDAIALADVEMLRELMTEKTTWRMCGRSPLAGLYEGPEAILPFMARVGELTEDLHSNLIDIFVNDRGAVMRYSVHAVRGPQHLDTEHLFLIRIENGRIREAVFAPVDQYAYDCFFSPQ